MMTARTQAAAFSAVAVALLLAACGGEPTSNATTAPTSAAPTVDLSQIFPVADRIFPPPRGGQPSADCFVHGLDSCPFTPRLKARVQAIAGVATGGGGDPVCRCQNTYTGTSVTPELVSGQPIAHVVLSFGRSAVRMDWVFVQSGGAWLADDSYCTTLGRSTSIYAQTGPCPA
jgi:hypothetical protein